jgi:tRNA threonylcarbamoyladenosine biosynthesis protein TsaE
MPEQVRVATADDMRALGRAIAARLQAGDLLILSGPLGAGKTTLVQGIGDGLNVRGPITSPTFVIARVHPPLGDGPALAHADAYRLGGTAEVDDLDLDSDTARAVTVVEWGEGMAEGLSEDRLEISIEITRSGRSGHGDDSDGPDPRIVRLDAIGPRWAGVTLAAPAPGRS